MHDAVALEELAARGRRRCLLIIGVFFALTELRVLGLLGGLHLFRYFEVRLHQLELLLQCFDGRHLVVADLLFAGIVSTPTLALSKDIRILVGGRLVTRGLLRSHGRVEV